MALEFLWRCVPRGSRIVVFPGAWNPPTIAHLGIAGAALRCADEVLWTIPRSFPHKPMEGASFEKRCEMIRAIAAAEPGFSAAITDGGLYVQMAREAREAYGADAQISVLCGRDAAERIEGWDYGRPGVFEEMLRDFELMVAARAGEYRTGAAHCGRIRTLDLEKSLDTVSSSEVRRRITSGENWESLVPAAIRDLVRSAPALQFPPKPEDRTR